MTYKIAYITYSGDDQELMNRSNIILTDFFVDEDYEIQTECKGIVFIASGGSEKNAIEITKNNDNITLLCHRESNSFAATLEIASYLRSKDKRVNIIDVMAPNAFTNFVEIQKVNQAIECLSKQKAAIIGKVSDWLINSDIENAIIKEKLGIELLRIPWNQLDDYRKKEASKEFLHHFPDFDEDQLTDTAKVYSLLKSVVKQYALSAISVECFSLVTRDKVTACLPLAVLNMKNKVAACEGDICSMLGKMLIRAIAGEIPWQANIAEIKEQTVLFAHCTAPLNVLKSFDITTHFETNCGTAIRGKFEKQEVGVFRIDNKLEKFMLLQGEIVNTPDYDFACRTQIEFKTSKEQISLLKEKSLGNHHLLFPAKHIPLLECMMQTLGLSRVN